MNGNFHYGGKIEQQWLKRLPVMKCFLILNDGFSTIDETLL